MLPILNSEQMAAADRFTIEHLGIAGIVLMEQAANACVSALSERLAPGDELAVLAGSGNNAGDGLAIARLLMEAGFTVVTYLAFPGKPFRGDALTNWNRLRDLGGVVEDAVDLPEDRFAWLVDALFGTGLNRPLSGALASLVQAINRHPARVLAVDLPSGLSGSRATLLGETVRADLTVTFQAPKIAHAATPAAAFCGDLRVCDIGISIDLSADSTPGLLDETDYCRPRRPLPAHKGSFGCLGIIGGFRGMQGAANLASLAALRFGVGKVRVLTNDPGNRFHHDSVMVSHIDLYQPEYQALVIGPGLSRDALVFDAIDRLDLGEVPIVWDADGLHYLKERRVRGAISVITPHPGEAASLLDATPGEIQADRLQALHGLGELFPDTWILLKGYRSLIRAPNGNWFSCACGNPALAVAGSGDVLSGMIGALLAQGMDAGQALRLACIRHAMAADHWSARYRDYSMLAEDIIEDLRH